MNTTTTTYPTLGLQKQKTTTRLYYQIDREISDQEMERIMRLDPKEMSDNEKLQWKLEIQRQAVKAGDYLSIRIKQIDNEKEKIAQLLFESKEIVSVYKEAVEKINSAASVSKQKYVIFERQPLQSSQKLTENLVKPSSASIQIQNRQSSAKKSSMQSRFLQRRYGFSNVSNIFKFQGKKRSTQDENAQAGGAEEIKKIDKENLELKGQFNSLNIRSSNKINDGSNGSINQNQSVAQLKLINLSQSQSTTPHQAHQGGESSTSRFRVGVPLPQIPPLHPVFNRLYQNKDYPNKHSQITEFNSRCHSHFSKKRRQKKSRVIIIDTQMLQIKDSMKQKQEKQNISNEMIELQ